MTRRGRAFVAAGVLLIVLIVVGMSLHVPYVTFSPGPVTNTLGQVNGVPLITIKGHRTYPSAGKLELTTVTESTQLDMVSAVRDWFSAHDAVVPEEIVKPPGESQQQVQQQNALEMRNSQESATAAALNHLGVKPVGTEVSIVQVTQGAPAQGKLQVGDVLTSVDGAPVRSAAQVATAVRAHQPGQPVRIGFSRDGAAHTVTITTRESGGHAIIGVETTETQVYPFTVNIELKNVGGPSAGLMFALGITDLLTPADLTGGRIIAGTGTITADGAVGAIGGIQQKIQGARASGATEFFVPVGNCNEAKRAKPSGIRLLKVSSLSDALSDLQSLRAGRTNQPLC